MERNMCGCGLRPKSKEERNLELRKDAARIVAGVESYSATDRTRKAAEVKAAFPPAKAATTKASAAKTTAKRATAAKKTVAKSASKGPARAGLSVGPHDGDVC
jgi:nucleoid-associated protein YgaU